MHLEQRYRDKKDNINSRLYQGQLNLIKFNVSLFLSLLQAVVYEKPGFEGSCLEIDSDVFSFCESEGDVPNDGANLDSTKMKSVGSLKITGGL